MRFLAVLALLVSSPLWARDAHYEGRYVDAHLHYVDFMQESEGMDAMFNAMDKARVEQAWVFGLPVVKKWEQSAPRRPRYFLGDEAPLYYYSATDDLLAQAIAALPQERRRRLVPFISGINPTDLNAARHVEALIERYPGLWRGIGEVITRHDDLTALTEGETPRANHPALMKVYRVAALLERYDNLYVDLSWSVREHYLLDDDRPREVWLTLINDHPDRFTLGTDLVGHFGSMKKILNSYRPLLNALPEEVARRVASDNAKALVPEKGAVAK